MLKKIISVSVSILMLLIITGCQNKSDPFKQPLDPESSYGEYVLALNNDFNADIIVLGADKYMDPRLNYRQIDNLCAEKLEFDETIHGYQALIILDMDSNLKLDDDDFNLLFDFVENNNKDLIYFGTNYSQQFEQTFSISGNEQYPGFGVFGCFPNAEGLPGYAVMRGIWTKEKNEIYKNEKITLPFVVAYWLYSNASGESYSW